LTSKSSSQQHRDGDSAIVAGAPWLSRVRAACVAIMPTLLEHDRGYIDAPRALSETESLLTVHEVAELLRVPASWVYERTRRRGFEQLPHLKIGKYLRFRLSEIELYLEALRRAQRPSYTGPRPKTKLASQ